MRRSGSTSEPRTRFTGTTPTTASSRPALELKSSKALAACRKHRSRSKRLACEKSAKSEYESKAKPQKGKKATNR